LDFRKKTISEVLGNDDVHDLIVSILQKELSTLRKETIPLSKTKSWGLNASMSGNLLRLDSFEIISVATRVNLMFELHKTGGIEELLLSERKIGDWIQIIFKANQNAMTFFSSGSTGDPKGNSHELYQLEIEAKFWVEKLQPKRIISFVPRHHIYGFIFSILLPKISGILREFREPFPSPSLRFNLKEGDVIIFTPYLIEIFSSFGFRFPKGIVAVSSTAPLTKETRQKGLDMGLEKIFEVYGSTETSGVGWKDDNLEGFFPLPFLENDFKTPDRIEWIENPLFEQNRFKILGRADNVVQVGGNNVSLNETRKKIINSNMVVDIAIRLDTDRLKMFAILNNEVKKEEFEVWLFENLESYERPLRIEYGSELPKNEFGKLADW
jgi:4-coumarate--CoA ligase (photoactive yellow protein activation family)